MRRLLFWMIATFLQLADAAGEVVQATSPEDLRVAIGDPAVSTIVMMADIALTDDWAVDGVASVSQRYVLTRNLTITGSRVPVVGSTWYPTLDATSFTSPRIFVPEGITITFYHVMLARLGAFSSIAVGSNGFGLLLLDGYSPGLQLVNDTVFIYPYCSPLSYALSFWRTLPRPASLPGNQTAQLLSGGWCAVPYPGTQYSGQCFPNAYKLVNVAYLLEQMAKYLGGNHTVPLPLRNVNIDVVILCNQLTTTNKTPAPLPPGPPPVLVPPSSAPVGVVVGASLGAAALLLLLAAGVICIRRRRLSLQEAVETSVSCKNSGANLIYESQKGPDEHCTTGVYNVSDESLVTPEYAIGRDQAITIVEGLAGCHADVANRDHYLQHSGIAPDLVDELHELSRSMQTSISDQQLHIQAVIGSGAYGTVYRGSWQGLQVAIKTLMFSSNTVGTSAGQAHGVLTEAALSKSISHPNVVATYSCDLQRVPMVGKSALALHISDRDEVVRDWRLYIIQEYCDGGSLKEALQASSDAQVSGSCTGQAPNGAKVSFTQMTAFELAFDIACGMCHLHERNVIHGDLNPANVLLKRTASGRWSPKVCDFGLSVHLPDNLSHMSNLRRGTPFYVAPEVLECGTMSRAADVYSMGVMLWELYMGQTVWQVSNAEEFELCDAFPLLPQSAPPSYLALLRECLHRDVRQRPTFVDIMTRLLQLCTGDAVGMGHAVCGPAPAGAALFCASTPDTAASVVGCYDDLTFSYSGAPEKPSPIPASGGQVAQGGDGASSSVHTGDLVSAEEGSDGWCAQ